MTGETKYAIDLTAEEAQLFKLFRQYQDTFQALVQGQVFSARGCQVDLHFDLEGTLHKIQAHPITYLRASHHLSPIMLLTVQQGTATIQANS